MADGEFQARSQRYSAAHSNGRAGAEEGDDAYGVEKQPEAPVAPVKREEPLPAVDRSWDTFWPLARRIKVFAVIMTLNLVLLPFSFLVVESYVAIAVTITINSLVQALVLGTFDRIRLRRSLNGKIVLTRTWRFCFYALEPSRIRWSEFEGLSCRRSHENHFEDWLVVLILFPYGILPAILWFWYVIRPERMQVALCKDHGFPDTVLFQSWKQAEAEELARTIREVTRLPQK